jgi:Ran GTPase-activating protein (RanGAP) involved in mRNA processing and transport
MINIIEFKNEKISKEILNSFIEDVNRTHKKDDKLVLWFESCDFSHGFTLHEFFCELHERLTQEIIQVSFTDNIVGSEQFENNSPVYATILKLNPNLQIFCISNSKEAPSTFDMDRFSAALFFHRKISIIEFKRIELTVEDASNFAVALRNNKSLISLELCEVVMPSHTFSSLMNAISNHETIRNINLSRLDFRGIATNGKVIYNFLKNEKKLTNLSLSGNPFTTKDYERLAKIIPRNTSLTKLSINEDLSDDLVVMFITAVGLSTSILNFNIKLSCALISKEVTMAIANVISKNDKLRSFILNGASEIDQSNAHAIVNAIEMNTVLETFNISRMSKNDFAFLKSIQTKCIENARNKSIFRRPIIRKKI